MHSVYVLFFSRRKFKCIWVTRHTIIDWILLLLLLLLLLNQDYLERMHAPAL